MDEYKRIKEYVTTNICTINDFLLHILFTKNSNDFVSLKVHLEIMKEKIFIKNEIRFI